MNEGFSTSFALHARRVSMQGRSKGGFLICSKRRLDSLSGKMRIGKAVSGGEGKRFLWQHRRAGSGINSIKGRNRLSLKSKIAFL
jgi:hypothetical protein